MAPDKNKTIIAQTAMKSPRPQFGFRLPTETPSVTNALPVVVVPDELAVPNEVGVVVATTGVYSTALAVSVTKPPTAIPVAVATF